MNIQREAEEERGRIFGKQPAETGGQGKNPVVGTKSRVLKSAVMPVFTQSDVVQSFKAAWVVDGCGTNCYPPWQG